MGPPDSPIDPDHLVQVFASSSIPEGLLARGLLESEGIPVVTKGEMDGPYRMGPVFLWVPQEDEDRARTLLAEAASDGGILPDEGEDGSAKGT